MEGNVTSPLIKPK